MNIIQLNDRIEAFVNKHELGSDALALKKEHAIAKSEEWRRVLDGFVEQGRVLRIGIIGRVKAGKSSMLNALLFNGNDILPKAATPMTAALTIMEYSETVRAEVDFFTKEDIDEIKAKHDAYVRDLERTIREKEQELIERALKKKKDTQKRTRFDVVLTQVELSDEEKRECGDKARKQAEDELKDHPALPCYDQYERMKSTGKSLADLEAFRTIQAAGVENLMGQLNQFVGSDGELMPFTKSVTLYIPEKGLQGLQIIDTPGINDPVTSRGERTEQLLQECDVVLMVSPSGQFLNSQDTALMNRVTTKEGTQQAYIIASQVDSQLFGSESRGLSNPIDVLQRISERLTGHARSVLQKQAEQYPEMKVALDKLNRNNVVCSSGVAFAMLQRFDAQQAWDTNMQQVWRNLSQKFPDTFNHAESAKNALAQLANMEKLHQIIEEVTANKEQILAARRVEFAKSKGNALQSYLKAWEQRINEQLDYIQTVDVGALRQQEAQVLKKQVQIDLAVGEVYNDLVFDIRLNLDKQLKEQLNSEMRQYDNASGGAKSTAQEEKRVYVGRGGFLWLEKKYETRHYEVQVVQATPIRRAIEDFRSNLEDKFQRIVGAYTQAWKKKIYSQVVGAWREAMGDDEVDAFLIKRAVTNILARMPEPAFKLDNDMPSILKQSGQLKGSEAEDYIGAADNYVSDMRHSVHKTINNYMKQLVKELSKVDLSKELTGNLSDSLQQLLYEIENKEASLYRYQRMREELAALQALAASF